MEQVGAFEQALYSWLDAHAPQYLEAVRTTGKLEGETEEVLKVAIADCRADFLKTH